MEMKSPFKLWVNYTLVGHDALLKNKKEKHTAFSKASTVSFLFGFYLYMQVY